MTEQLATFGAGCFWGVEAAFRRVPGVIEVTSGYMGGSLEQPSYRDVCSDETGHAEVVQVRFNSMRVSYETLLDVFWAIHDPTTLNRQGPDVGTQYRSVIFTHDTDQMRIARASFEREQGSGRHRRPIVTEIANALTFWPAEEYHQRYVERTGRACHFYAPDRLEAILRTAGAVSA